MGLTLILLLGVAARLTPWSQVFTPDGLRYRGNDAYYHLLRIQTAVRDYPHVPARDAWMNYPRGATVPWPPLFDLAVASAAKGTGGADPSPEWVERLAALFPVGLGLVALALAHRLAFLLGGRGAALRTGILVAVLPASALFGCVGRVDQHAAELVCFLWILMAFHAGWSRRPSPGNSWGADLILGLGIAVAFWTWLGSSLHLLFLVGFAGLWHLVTPEAGRMARSLARGGAIGAAALTLTLIAFGPEDGALFKMSLLGLTGFHVVVVAMVAIFGGLLLGARRIPGKRCVTRRTAEVALAAALPLLAAILLLPGFRVSVHHGLVALGAASDWYRNIQEFDPLVFAGFEPVATEAWTVLKLLGLGLLTMPVAAWLLVLRWRGEPDRRADTLLVLVLGIAFVVLAFARQRFVLYLAVPLAFWVAVVWERLDASVMRRVQPRRLPGVALSALVGVLLLVPGLWWHIEQATAGPDSRQGELVTALEWLRNREPTAPGREAVFAEWSYGHHIRTVARRPVLVNPFGTDLGEDAMRDAAAIFLSRGDKAGPLLEARRIGTLLLANPITEACFAHAFAPPGTPVAVRATRSWPGLYSVEVTPAYWDLVVTRLFFFDGLSRFERDHALGQYRLIYESATLEGQGAAHPAFKLFEVVPGAAVAAAVDPGTRITARAPVFTNQGRTIDWATSAVADATGRAVLRLPYATGRNGEVTASAYEVRAGERQATVTVTERDAVEGRLLPVDLSGD